MELPHILKSAVTYLALLPAAATQSFVGGDLSRQAPYGIPSQEFSCRHNILAQVSKTSSFPHQAGVQHIPIRGAGVGRRHRKEHYRLVAQHKHLSVIAPGLSHASDGSIDKGDVTEATTLSIEVHQHPCGV